MTPLFIDDFSSGWCPSDHFVKGRKDGLLKMTNVALDETGVLRLCRGVSLHSSGYDSPAVSIFSARLLDYTTIFVATESGKVYIDGSDTGFSAGVVDGKTAAFILSNGFVLTFYGDIKKKYHPSVGWSALVVPPIDITDVTLSPGSAAFTGQVSYMAVNVENSGSYQAKSVNGQEFQIVVPANQVPTIVLPVPGGTVSEIWIYRRSATLGQWYRVGVVSAGTGTFVDNVSDTTAIQINETRNNFVVSVDTLGSIVSAIGFFGDRNLYFTEDSIYFSSRNDPTTVNLSHTISLTSVKGEKFRWARKAGENVILIATSKGFYVLRGTFLELPDGFLDVFFRPLNENLQIALSEDAVTYGSNVVYYAADGWRLLSASGDSQLLIDSRLDLLYKREARYDYAAPTNPTTTIDRFSCCIANNNLYVSLSTANRIEVFDFTRKSWRVIESATRVFTLLESDEADNVYGFDKTGLSVYNLEVEYAPVDASSTKIDILFPLRNVFPKQRKDLAAVSLCYELTGTANCHILHTKNYRNVVSVNPLDNFAVAGGFEIIPPKFPVDDFSIRITGDVTRFSLSWVCFTFSTRPVQTTFLRIPANNFGSSAKKQVQQHPFKIDTLDSQVTLEVYADNTLFDTIDVRTDYPETVAYAPNKKCEGVDFEYVFIGGIFEFYGMQQPVITFKDNEAVEFFQLRSSNFGTAAKKRIRTLPFVLNCKNSTVVFHPVVDGVETAISTFTGNGQKTYFHFFNSDVFGIDYGGYFTSDGPFEVIEQLKPEVVQSLPVAKQFDQVGPIELFRYGKVQALEIRILSDENGELPFEVFLEDVLLERGSIVVTTKEESHEIKFQKTVAGTILRVTFGPTAFSFYRFYARVKIVRAGKDTEMEWVNV